MADDKSAKLYDHKSKSAPKDSAKDGKATGEPAAEAKVAAGGRDAIDSDVGAKHSAQRTAMHARQAHERATVHHRHHVEHSTHAMADDGKKGGAGLKEVHDRHEAEIKDLHKRHQKEADGLMETQGSEAPAPVPGGADAMAASAGAPDAATAAAMPAAAPGAQAAEAA